MSTEDTFHSPPDDEDEDDAAEDEGEDTFENILPATRGGGRRSYSERVRAWGNETERQPEQSSAQSLAPPARRVSNVGNFNTLLSASLLPIPASTISEAGGTVGGGPPTKTGSVGPPPTRTTNPQPSILRGAGGGRRGRGGASTIQGKKAFRLSVLPVSGNSRAATNLRESAHSGGMVPYGQTAGNRALSFAPKRLLDIENGKSILVTDQRFLNQARYQELGHDGALVVTAKGAVPIAKEDAIFFNERGSSLLDQINSGEVRDLVSNSEVDFLGGAWRGTLRRLMLMSLDEINGLRLGRQMQLFLPFQTAYESYVLGQLIEALDSNRKSEVDYVLKVAFRNRNASRIIVQLCGPRWDFLFHWHQAVTWNRWYDSWGQFPIVGITAFPASENFPATRNHAFASISRVVFGPGNWLSRVITQGREGLDSDNPEKNVAQNLAAESNGFELANRNQFGTYVGRRRTNYFRLDHRLPTDESIVRTFVAQPLPTMVNNGVVHTLRQLAKHWHNMLFLPSGNFAHQRMEQLDPFETMRFHMPVVCIVLSSLRGRNAWDASHLGPFIRKCQELKPSLTADSCRYLARDMQENIIVNLCAGVASIVDPLRSWLDAIHQACDGIEAEAKLIYETVTTVEIGIRLGHDLITQVSWKIPSDSELKKAILNHIRGLNPGLEVSERRIRNAMLLTTPRDKRTLIELVKNNLASSTPAKLLLGRVKTLLQRDLRREATNEAIRELALGDYISDVLHDEWYWLEEGEKRRAYIYDAKVTGRDLHRFVHVDSGLERFVSLSDGMVKCRAYVPVAEAISRAQRAFMVIELDYGKKYKFNGFMEFSFLRNALRRMVVLSQIVCEELDNARLNVLREVQRSTQVQVAIHDLEPGRTYYTYDSKTKAYEPFYCEKEYTPADPEWSTLARTKIVKIPPQSTIVIGGGPTGLMTTIHCTETVLVSGGVMKLYEARDAFAKGGSTFERAQIVRLDARWIAMLRYHLGTGYEDVYVPASGETDAQLGNTLPAQGFVEITIKDLENMLHVELSKLWSKGLLQCYTNSKAAYDPATNNLTKEGAALKIEDLILRRVDPNGNRSNESYSWKIADLVYAQALGLDDLLLGEEYGVYVRLENAVHPFKLTGVDLDSATYNFKALTAGVEDLKATGHNLPSVYPKGTTRHADVSKVIVECTQKGSSSGYARDELSMKDIKKEKFTLDTGHTHVVECIGKPFGSNVHFCCTTYEPYGVCCIQGLKISMGMHNFGETRWGQGIVDDIRSTSDQNTRIIGDFTKMVRQAPVAQLMYDLMKGENWQAHFKNVVAESKFPELDSVDPVVTNMLAATEWHAEKAPTFRRQTLQTRFFETGDNYYLGMEFTREYDRWKIKTSKEICASLTLQNMDDAKKKDAGRLEGIMQHHIDRLWYEACLEVIRQGDVYNPGASGRVPILYMTNSYFDVKLGTLPVGESFRLSDRPEEKYEVVIKDLSQVVVRNIEGYISKMTKATIVKREGNLTRQPDGNTESRVALATFPVAHYVNFRTVRLNDENKGYVFAFIGDEQSTPHFMRYSGLTGACVNAMLFNNFLRQANDGVSFQDRFALYSKETNWNNGEVVSRGTGANYGQDGFLRPGFAYDHGIDYLHSKVIECMETKQDLDNLLSRDWKIKFAASFVPRGMELNEDFIRSLYRLLQMHIFNKFMTEVKADKAIASDDSLEAVLMARKEAMAARRDDFDHESYWSEFLSGIDNIDDTTRMRLEDFHCAIAKRLEQVVCQVVEFATLAYIYNERISSELFNQPKPVDSIVDDFAVEAQNFANSLTMSAAFSSAALAFTLVDIRGDGSNVGSIWAAIIGGLNILLSFGTMANVSRYKIRNEQARIYFFEEKLLAVKKGVFSLMDRKTQDTVPESSNPFSIDLEAKMNTFILGAEYYDVENPNELKDAYAAFKANLNDPDAIRDFQKKLTTHFIPELYHVNSYLQEYLVDIFKILEGMHVSLTQQVDKASGGDAALQLFDRLNAFTPVLDKSLQRGHIYWGFLKSRRLLHWDCTVVFRYFYSLLCCARAGGSTPLAPIQTETLGVVKKARALSSLHQNQILRREVRDLEVLYWATRESDIASLIFVSGFLVFLASWIFSISRIISRAGGSDVVTDVAFWAVLASATGAILGAIHLVRKFFILMSLWFTLGTKARNAPSVDDREAIRRVKSVTFTQILLTLARIGAAGAAAVALPWSVAQNGFDDSIDLGEQIPFWIAVGAIGAAVGSTIFFFMVEYVVRYNLSPRLGEYICEAFREEIENMYKVLDFPINDIQTKQVQERETWEYVAREFLHKYRFDAVFAADRFGSILQYIQSGMDPRGV